MWQATLQSGALDLFDVQTVYRISEFYNELNDGFEQLQQLRDLSERMLLPVAGSAAAEYYDLHTGGVRPKYLWYFQGMNEVGAQARNITKLGDSLVIELKNQEKLAGYSEPRALQDSVRRAQQ